MLGWKHVPPVFPVTERPDGAACGGPGILEGGDMDLIAVVQAVNDGAAQVMTFAIPIGVFAGILFWGFFQRSRLG